jgi:CMP-N-acetylneuraminic acid synthetase
MKLGALIPARIGSKRLRKKNILNLGGKPLLCWSIDTLLEADIFDDITVSTESEEVADVVRNIYSEKEVKILMRPEELAGDDSSLDAVQAHYLENRLDIEWFGLFMPTYPFRKKEKIHDAIRALYSGYAWRVISVRADENCSMDYYYPKDDGVGLFFQMQPFFAANNISTYMFYQRNMIGELWARAGMTNTERVRKIYADVEECIDIDTAADFKIAEKVVSGYKPFFRKPIFSELGDWTLIMPEGTDIEGYKKYLAGYDMTDMSAPLLFLQEARLPVSTFRCFDGIRRSYWMSEKAVDYMNYSRAKKTGNNAYIPIHYNNSKHYRLLRNMHPQNPYDPPADCDKDGIMFGSNSAVPKAVPLNRIIFQEKVETEPWYVDPLDFVKSAAD